MCYAQDKNIMENTIQKTNTVDISYACDQTFITKRQELLNAGVTYILVEPSDVEDLWLQDEYRNERRLSDISYYHKTMIIAGEDFNIIDLVDSLGDAGTTALNALLGDSMYAVSGVIMHQGEVYTDLGTGTSYTVDENLDIVEVN